MPCRGVFWDPPEHIVIEAIRKTRGQNKHTCALLQIDIRTYLKYLSRHPDVVAERDEERNGYHDHLLDSAEECLEKAMQNQGEDPSNALKASFYVLNSKGDKRGWTNTLEKGGNVYLVKRDPTESGE